MFLTLALKETKHYPSTRVDAQDSDLAPFFGNLRQSETPSEIKPPLKLTKKASLKNIVL